ncbi:MAG: HigA family addiction module antidote protein [Bacteroidales bacterium]|jgi:addiction module HigA family antidote|nr:HigA family addiction module antidote protein [Bacteroidales bacterium]
MANLVMGYKPTHPGEVLKDEIEYRGLSQINLARNMGMSYKALNQILNEKRPLTETTAMLFEAALDVPADVLMRLQYKYNMRIAQKDKTFAKRLAQIRKMAAMF